MTCPSRRSISTASRERHESQAGFLSLFTFTIRAYDAQMCGTLLEPRPWRSRNARSLIWSRSFPPPELELVCKDRSNRLLLLNITQDVDCLDLEGSTLGPMNWKLSFVVEHRLPESGLFKIPQAGAVHVLSLERDDEPDSFRTRVERLELVGLEFEPMWSSADGLVSSASCVSGSRHGRARLRGVVVAAVS